MTDVDIARLARHGLVLRQWERQHMPTEGTQLGYEVFMKLAELVAADDDHSRAGLLKRLYLELPYSEKGIRLHLRRLESTGWITVHKIGDGRRAVRVELRPAYWKLLNAYAVQWLVHVAEVVADRCIKHKGLEHASPSASHSQLET